MRIDKNHSGATSHVAVTTPIPSTTKVRLRLKKDCIRRFDLSDSGKDLSIVHIYPLLSDWRGRQLSDEGVNPRSHNEDSLRSPVAKGIENTLLDHPEDFFLANRGLTVLAESVHYNPKSEILEILSSDPELHGVADGATTDAVLAQVQERISVGEATIPGTDFKIPQTHLSRGRIHVELIIGLEAKERIDRLVLGRNTSIQVRPWSMSDFRGCFDWLREILEKPGSEFRGKIGYEENAGAPINILDILSILTLFHQDYDGKGRADKKAPTVAYSSKGRMDARLNSPSLAPGYKALSPILKDILRLHDHVYSNFEDAYRKARGGRAKLGLREGFVSRKRDGEPLVLHLTGKTSNYEVPSGVLFPLLASLRALVGYDNEGRAYWKADPFKFFDKNGPDLIATLIEQVELLGGNPQTAGKKKAVYTTVHAEARLFLSEAAEQLEFRP